MAHLKKCSCKACRRGLHTDAGGFTARSAVRKDRKKVKAALKKGEEPPKAGSIPYTD